MLLGIGLHAAISFIPMPLGIWPVQDTHQHAAFGWFMAATHGFRMPLFFLLSGFFTAVLWRKRGLKALLQHRFKRIFVPLAIGMLTIIPVTWAVMIGVGILGRESANNETPIDANPSLWTAALSGDVEQIRYHLDQGVDPNEPDPTHGATPLAMAAVHGHSEAVEILLERGAEVDSRNRDGGTASHGAAFLGHAQTARVLIKHATNVELRNDKGERPRDVLGAPWGITSRIAGMLRVRVDREQVDAGRAEVLRMLDEVRPAKPNRAATIADDSSDSAMHPRGMARTGDPNHGPQAFPDAGSVFGFLTHFPMFHHLWFPWFLCWLVAVFAVYATLLGWMKLQSLPKWLVISPLHYAWLIPLTMLPQSFMGLLIPSFGPDTSTGLLPIPHVLFYYAIFFFFGAIYFDCHDDSGRLGRWWWITLPFALAVLFPIGYELTTGAFGFGDRLLNSAYHRPLSVLLQAAYAWLMTFGMIGLFRTLHSTESRAMRYVSDSSYWLYLAHLPLIIVAQFVVRNVALPSLFKFTIVCVTVSVFLLGCYQLFVRYTLIGSILNGPRPVPIQAELRERQFDGGESRSTTVGSAGSTGSNA